MNGVVVAVLVGMTSLIASSPAAVGPPHRRLTGGRSATGAPARRAGWRPRLGRRPSPRRGRGALSSAVVALVLDLVAATVGAGASVQAALAVVAEAVGGPAGSQLRGVADALALGVPAEVAWACASPAWSPLERCLRLSAATGAPVAALLREAATSVRRAAHRDALVSASQLSVRVVLPLGLCALPAFLLLAVAPVVIALGSALLAG